MASDSETPFEGLPWFYLVTVENPAGEGPMGTDSFGVDRANGNACP